MKRSDFSGSRWSLAATINRANQCWRMEQTPPLHRERSLAAALATDASAILVGDTFISRWPSSFFSSLRPQRKTRMAPRSTMATENCQMMAPANHQRLVAPRKRRSNIWTTTSGENLSDVWTELKLNGGNIKRTIYIYTDKNVCPLRCASHTEARRRRSPRFSLSFVPPLIFPLNPPFPPPSHLGFGVQLRCLQSACRSSDRLEMNPKILMG